MATKKKATGSADLTGTKKPAIRGGTGRSKARDADAGVPPEGALDEAAVETAIHAWKTKQVKSKSDYVNYATKTIVADAEEMVRGQADLSRFGEIKAPISDRDLQCCGC